MDSNKFDRDKANLDLINAVKKIITDELPLIKERVNKQFFEIKVTKYLIHILSLALFIVGIFFLIIALSTVFSSSNGLSSLGYVLEVLGFGSASGLSFISILLLNPIKKIQESNSNAIQAEMINQCWEMGILLYIRAMDLNDRESVKEAVQNISDLTFNSIDLLEKYYEIKSEK